MTPLLLAIIVLTLIILVLAVVDPARLGLLIQVLTAIALILGIAWLLKQLEVLL